MTVNAPSKRLFRDLKELHIAIYECRKCQEKGRQVANIQPRWDPARGHLQAEKWGMWIGQAPGSTEEKRATKKTEIRSKADPAPRLAGIPGGMAFVGDAGQRFRGWLMDAGFSEDEIRTQLYKTSIIKCYPGKRRGGGDRQPGRTEIELCRNFLEAQIGHINPKVLIPMGLLAIHWFFPDLGLGEAVGKRLIWQGRDVVCFPHASRASNWWKKQENKDLLFSSINIIRELRKETMPVGR
jgi:uracil-DNA glycosylase